MQTITSSLKDFFENNELAKKAADSIKNGREIGLSILVDGKPTDFTFTKEKGRNALKEGTAASPDLVFSMSENAAQALVSKKFETVGQVGLHIFEKMLSNDPAQKIQVRIKSGVLSLVTGGYLGVLTAGGSEVAKFLASKGLGNMGKLKDAIGKLKG